MIRRSSPRVWRRVPRGRMAPLIALALVLALLVPLAAGCERRAQDAPAAGAPSARLLVTAGHGAEVLLDTRVTPGRSVMATLRGATRVRTQYGGGFVAEMFGRRSDAGAQRDWFLFADGLLSPVGAKQVPVRADGVIWWDFRDWAHDADPWAVVGVWPLPFTAPGRRVFAEAPLRDALAAAGARVDGDEDAAWRVRVGASAAIAGRDAAWRRALADPAGAGLGAWIDGDRVMALDATTGESVAVPGGRALIAVVPVGAYPEDGVLMVVAGIDEDAAAAAARALAADPGLVARAYSLVLDGAGVPLRAGGRPAS